MRSIRRIAARLAATAVAVLACLLAALWWGRRGDTILPEPTGPFGVGRAAFHWRNRSATPQPLAPEAPSAELVVWIWYPTEKNPAAPALPYLPAPWLAVMQRGNRLPFSLLMRDLARVHAHSVRGPVSPRQRRYPVVILRGGLGAKILDYTTLAEDLASHGFVVVGFDAPYRTGVVVFPDGRVVTRPAANNPETLSESARVALANRLLTGWVADTRFVLDELARLDAADSTGAFTGRLDLDAVGVMGHSLGGATAAQVCHDDPRCKAGIDIDGAPLGALARTSVGRPFMFLLSEHGDTAAADPRRIMADLRAIYDKLPANDGYWVTIRGTRHFNFSDQALLRNAHVFRLFSAIGPIDPRRALAVTAEYVHRFFGVYLDGAPRSALAPSRDFPEAEVAPRSSAAR